MERLKAAGAAELTSAVQSAAGSTSITARRTREVQPTNTVTAEQLWAPLNGHRGKDHGPATLADTEAGAEAAELEDRAGD